MSDPVTFPPLSPTALLFAFKYSMLSAVVHPQMTKHLRSNVQRTQQQARAAQHRAQHVRLAGRARPREEQRRRLSRLGRAARRIARLGRVPGCELGRFWFKATQIDDDLRCVEIELRTLATSLFDYQLGPAAAAAPCAAPVSYTHLRAHET